MLQMWGRRRPNLPCGRSGWRACAGSAAHGETGSRAEPRTTAAHRSLQGFLGYLSPKWKSGSAVEGTLAQGTATAGASPEQTTPMHAWNGWRVLGRRFKRCHQNRGSGVTPSLPRADAQDMLRSSGLTHRVAAFSRGKSFPEIMPSAADSRSQKAYMLRSRSEHSGPQFSSRDDPAAAASGVSPRTLLRPDGAGERFIARVRRLREQAEAQGGGKVAGWER